MNGRGCPRAQLTGPSHSTRHPAWVGMVTASEEAAARQTAILALQNDDSKTVLEMSAENRRW